jgi:phosphate-selective porin OprO/OprP
VIPVGGFASLTVGKQKEGFSYEIVGDAANLVQVERLMNAFAGTRNIGLKLGHTALGDRATWSIGVYNDWFAQDLDLDESGTQVVARVTGLPFESEDRSRYLHLGGAWRRNGADQDAIRYRGRPESNVTDYYVDTGLVPASEAQQFLLELLYNHGPVSLTGEYTEAHVDALDSSDPVFRGYYFVGSWVMSGEHRPYDRKVGYARRILPTKRWGALELFARYGLVDLTDKQVAGGYMTKFFTGVNWWVNRRIRLTAGYGRASLDKLGVTGHTNQYFTRVQWIY